MERLHALQVGHFSTECERTSGAGTLRTLTNVVRNYSGSFTSKEEIMKLANIRIALIVPVLAMAGACSKDGGKCEKLIDKSFSMATEMMKGFAAMGDKAEADKKLAEMKKEMEAAKPQAIEACKKAVKEDPNVEKAIDCIVNAADMEAMSKCEGADKLKHVMRPNRK